MVLVCQELDDQICADINKDLANQRSPRVARWPRSTIYDDERNDDDSNELVQLRPPFLQRCCAGTAILARLNIPRH